MICGARALALSSILFSAAGSAAGAKLTMSTGLDYSRGDYGGTRSTETWVVPVIAKYESGPLTLKASLPYIRTTGPGDVIGIGPDRVPTEGAENVRRTADGMGDLVLTAGYTVVQNSSLLLDLIGKVKVPTANEDRGLGTGKTDYAVQLDAATVVKGVTVFGTLGWKRYGDPEGVDYRDPLYASIGAGYRVVPSTFVGASYDWRDNVTRTGAEIREAALFASHTLSKQWKIQGYLITGFSDNSPDIGGGLILSHIYR